MAFDSKFDFGSNRLRWLKTFGRKCFFWFGVLYVAITGGGGCNVFYDLGNQKSDPALIDDAVNDIDQKLYTDAITVLGNLTAVGQARRDVKVLLATAYAGRGGLDLISLAQILSAGSTKTLFQLLMTSYKGSTVSNFNDLITAETTMQGVAVAAANRTVDENVFMIFLELTKLGTLLAARADANGDGVLDGTFNSCTGLSNLEASHVATAVGNLIDSVTASGSTVGGSFISTLNTDCASLPGLCTVTQVSAVTGPEIQVAKTLVGETNLAIGLAVPAQAGFCELAPPFSGTCPGSATTLCP